MVRLQADGAKVEAEAERRFNSKMVRLQALNAALQTKILTMFQFQNGAIASEVVFPKVERVSEFQFQNGAIASQHFGREKFKESAFQFQNGAIASRDRRLAHHLRSEVSIPKWCDCKQKALLRVLGTKGSFNSKMVRLQGAVLAGKAIAT